MAGVIEDRVDDSCCALESVLQDNREALCRAKENGVNYILIDGEYRIRIELEK
jgi:hypothetical protein